MPQRAEALAANLRPGKTVLLDDGHPCAATREEQGSDRPGRPRANDHAVAHGQIVVAWAARPCFRRKESWSGRPCHEAPPARRFRRARWCFIAVGGLVASDY